MIIHFPSLESLSAYHTRTNNKQYKRTKRDELEENNSPQRCFKTRKKHFQTGEKQQKTATKDKNNRQPKTTTKEYL